MQFRKVLASVAMLIFRRKKVKIVTNLEKLREMPIDELARWMCQYMECSLSTYQKRCPGYQFCRHGDGKSNGLIAWLGEKVEE